VKQRIKEEDTDIYGQGIKEVILWHKKCLGIHGKYE
jgi:hypothetical protein